MVRADDHSLAHVRGPLPVVACKITALMAILRSKLSEAQCANFTVIDVDVAAAALVVTCTCSDQHHITHHNKPQANESNKKGVSEKRKNQTRADQR